MSQYLFATITNVACLVAFAYLAMNDHPWLGGVCLMFMHTESEEKTGPKP